MSAVDVVAVNPTYINKWLTNVLITFIINGKTTFIYGPVCLL